MFSKFNIVEVITDGLKLLSGKHKFFPFVLFYFLLPAIIAVGFVLVNISIDNDIISNIISSLSLFSGLLFSVIFILTGNYATRKTLLSSSTMEEEVKKYLDRYKEFTNNTSTLILFSLILAILTIVLLFSYSLIEKTGLQIDHSYLLKLKQLIL